MTTDLHQLVEHDLSDDCPICRAQDIVAAALLPAAAAWEQVNDLPRFSVALHGAASMLGVMLEEGISRSDIDTALAAILDDIEAAIDEEQMMGGPPQGSA